MAAQECKVNHAENDRRQILPDVGGRLLGVGTLLNSRVLDLG